MYIHIMLQSRNLSNKMLTNLWKKKKKQKHSIPHLGHSHETESLNKAQGWLNWHHAVLIYSQTYIIHICITWYFLTHTGTHLLTDLHYTHLYHRYFLTHTGTHLLTDLHYTHLYHRYFITHTGILILAYLHYTHNICITWYFLTHTGIQKLYIHLYDYHMVLPHPHRYSDTCIPTLYTSVLHRISLPMHLSGCDFHRYGCCLSVCLSGCLSV